MLTGDIHSNWVNDLKVDFADANSPAVATEFVGTSITSGGDGSDLPDNMKAVLAENPFVKFHNGQRGYVTCDVTAKQAHADYQVVDFVTGPARRSGPVRRLSSKTAGPERCRAKDTKRSGFAGGGHRCRSAVAFTRYSRIHSFDATRLIRGDDSIIACCSAV